MAKKKAFVRYADNKLVPGSTIIASDPPKVGIWKEIPYDLCCENPPATTTTTTTSSPFQPVVVCFSSDPCNIVRCVSETVYLYATTIQIGSITVPVTKVLTSQNPSSIAIPGQYLTFIDGFILVVGDDGILTNVTTCP